MRDELKEITAGMPPRLVSVLALYLEGKSEKQAAIALNISPHTVHAYSKELHKRFGVSSRGELLAKAYMAIIQSLKSQIVTAADSPAPNTTPPECRGHRCEQWN